MKLFILYQKGKLANKNLKEIEVPRKINFKIYFSTIVISLVISLPMIFLFISLLTIYSPVRIMFWITLILIFLAVSIFFSLVSIVNVLLAKNYLESNEKLQNIDTKALYIYYLVNPLNILVGIIIPIIICFESL